MAMEAARVQLTAHQERVVVHDGGLLRVSGGSGTGKTTALVRRYLRLARDLGAAQVLVLARDRSAADRFRRAVLRHLRGGFETIAITTAWGVAFDIVRRHGRRPRLLSRAEHWQLVQELLRRDDGRDHWPTLGPLTNRRAFVDEVASAISHARAAGLGPGDVRAMAGARWAELAQFFERYLAALEARGVVDGAGVLVEAAHLLDGDGLARTERARHPQLLVDDYETATPAVHLLLRRLCADRGSGLTVAGNPDVAVGAGHGAPAAAFRDLEPELDVVLERAFRHPVEPVLVRCTHPSTEAEAVAGRLLAARDEGVAWDDMAVLLRNHGPRSRAVTRALVRHGVPVVPGPEQVGDEPVVRGLVDLLRWAHGDATALDRLLASPLAELDAAEVRRIRQAARNDGTLLEDQPALARLVSIRDALADPAAADDVATLAHRAFTLSLGHLVRLPGEPTSPAEERALDAAHRFLQQVSRHVEHHPGTRLSDYLAHLEAPSGGHDPWWAASSPPGTVAVTTVAASRGEEWHTVVLAGCVEGELPRVDGAARFFDRAALGGGPPAPHAGRRLASLGDERRLFALACSRATGALVAVAAPEPGVLLSRFVEGWAEAPSQLPLEHGQAPPGLAPTAGARPMWQGEGLSLSASQLDTYQDCPLKHAYRYGLGVRGQAGVHANLGNLVHRVLERFCDPTGPVPAQERTLERLHQLADECWRDDLAPYRPQLEEARRDLFAMLDLWWEHEGGDQALTVLATEHPFHAEVGPHRLTGRIDRVDRLYGDGGLRVVDYKTGKSKPKADEMADDIQLATYHLGASRDPELASWGPVRELRLLHMRTMTAYEQEITPGHEQATEQWVLEVARRMQDEDLEPNVHADCDHCEFHRLCPLWPEGREVGQE
jgi:superfamily I DNA/RNA helicase/RecB family exonuclease